MASAQRVLRKSGRLLSDELQSGCALSGGQRPRQRLRAREPVCHRLLGGFRPVGDALDVDRFDVSDAEESEHRAQVAALVLEGLERPARVDPAAGLHENDLLTREETLGTLLGVAEGTAGARDVIDPRLQRRGNAEIVHGRCDYDDVRGEKLVDERVGLRQNRILSGSLGPLLRSDRRHEILVDVGQRLARHVPHHHLGSGMSLLQLGKHPVAHAVGKGFLATRAAGHVKDIGHDGSHCPLVAGSREFESP